MDINFTIPDFWFGVLVTVISVPILFYVGAIVFAMLVFRKG